MKGFEDGEGLGLGFVFYDYLTVKYDWNEFWVDNEYCSEFDEITCFWFSISG